MLAWLSVWSEVQACIWPSWCHCHSPSLASVKSRLVLPFWYRLTWVVPGKGPLSGCVTYLLTYSESRWDGCGACGLTDCVLWLAGTWVESWCMIGRKRRSTCSSARHGCLRVTCMAHWTRPSLRRRTRRRSASTTSSPSTRSGRHTVLTWRHVTWPQNQDYLTQSTILCSVRSVSVLKLLN